MNDLISRHAVIDALHIRFADGFDEAIAWMPLPEPYKAEEME